jgi:hypothetical protein
MGIEELIECQHSVSRIRRSRTTQLDRSIKQGKVELGDLGRTLMAASISSLVAMFGAPSCCCCSSSVKSVVGVGGPLKERVSLAIGIPTRPFDSLALCMGCVVAVHTALCVFVDAAW